MCQRDRPNRDWPVRGHITHVKKGDFHFSLVSTAFVTYLFVGNKRREEEEDKKRSPSSRQLIEKYAKPWPWHSSPIFIGLQKLSGRRDR